MHNCIHSSVTVITLALLISVLSPALPAIVLMKAFVVETSIYYYSETLLQFNIAKK